MCQYYYEGLDRCGKTTLSVAHSEYAGIPYYKGERYPIDKDSDKHIIKMVEVKQFADLIQAIKPKLIVDRFHLSELVYSMSFCRKIDEDFMVEIDQILANAGGVIIFIDTPISVIMDRLPPFSPMRDHSLLSTIRGNYHKLLNWTKCQVIKINPSVEGFNIHTHLELVTGGK